MKKNWKKNVATALALVMLCMNYVPAMAAAEQNDSYILMSNQEVNEQVEVMSEFSCWNCGNYSSYTTSETIWNETARAICTHGKGFCITERGDVYSLTNCTYCHYTHTRTLLRTEYRYRCI